MKCKTCKIFLFQKLLFFLLLRASYFSSSFLHLINHEVQNPMSPFNLTDLFSPRIWSSFFFPLNSIITDANNVSRELSLHPVHLTPDKEGNLPPSALVPFCFYQGERSFLGNELPVLNNMTVCDKFHLTILEGQLCHTLDLKKHIGREHPTKSGKSNGLFLLLDPNPDQLGQANDKDVDSNQDDQNVKVFIHTLAQYTTFGPGSYGMGALKKMTGTTSFKQLPDYQKNCLVHNREECQTGKYLEQVRKECQCAPWALVSNQVECKIKIAKGTTDPRVEFC